MDDYIPVMHDMHMLYDGIDRIYPYNLEIRDFHWYLDIQAHLKCDLGMWTLTLNYDLKCDLGTWTLTLNYDLFSLAHLVTAR